MPTLIAPLAAVLIAQAAPLPAVANGVVTDAQTGQPLGGMLVQQQGAVTSAFTQPDGTFRLLLDKSGQPSLVISGVGYESVTLPVGAGRDLAVSLKPVSGFVPAAPSAGPAPFGTSAAETAPFNSGLSIAYRVRQQSLEANGAAVSGWANNDFRLAARYRWSPWLLEAEGSHHQTPVDMQGIDRQQNPAFSPSTWQLGARAGRFWALGTDLEVAGLLGYRWSNTVPNNSDIRYTGSPIDFEQTRHAVGLVGQAAWRPNRGPWHLEGGVGLYPLVLANAKAPGDAYAGSFLTDVRANLGYEVMPGLRLGIGAQGDWWVGNGSDNAMLYSVQMFYTPGGLPRGNE